MATPPGSDQSQALSYHLDTPYMFLKPSTELYSASILAAKGFLDPIAIGLHNDYELLHEGGPRKRKRRGDSGNPRRREVQLRYLYLDGFGVDQVWSQATQIINAAANHVEHNIPSPVPHNQLTDQIQLLDDGRDSDAVSAGSGSEVFDGSLSMSSGDDGNTDSGLPSVDGVDDEDSESDLEQIPDKGEGFSDAEGPNNEVYREDAFGLNDGFFSIDDFNKQTQFFENQDSRGDNDVEDDSENEAIDWHVDPVLQGPIPPKAKTNEQPSLMGNPGEEDDDDDSVIEGMDHSLIDPNNIKYGDFFVPPPQKASAQKSRPLPKTQPGEADLDTELNRAMADVRRDLFDEDFSDNDSGASSLNKNESSRNEYSTHEKLQARIANEIRRLEAENVAKKKWTLAGEARSVERPLNSLIEEDFDFERAGKPVPVVTNETSEEIEALVKRRIIAKEFDEVIKRLPTSLSTQTIPREKFGLDDSKPQQSLAELYEADYLRSLDPNQPSPTDQKLQEQHQRMLGLWREISGQLDSLSNWHYKPKVPSANINVVADVATVTMEDARPSATSAVANRGMLAPQEIYNPVETARHGEVVLKNGASLAKDEMSREEKLRRRRRKKERGKKSEPQTGNLKSRKATEKADLFSQLRRGGVKVVGDKGQLKDVDGRPAKEAASEQAERWKL